MDSATMCARWLIALIATIPHLRRLCLRGMCACVYFLGYTNSICRFKEMERERERERERRREREMKIERGWGAEKWKRGCWSSSPDAQILTTIDSTTDMHPGFSILFTIRSLKQAYSRCHWALVILCTRFTLQFLQVCQLAW